MGKAALIFLGSGIGGVLRYFLGAHVQRLAKGFPIGTLMFNLVGCLLIGYLSTAVTNRFPMREEYRLCLIVGILGGFTTFSAFGLETFALINEGYPVRAALNILLSVGLGLACVWLGHQFAIRA